MSNKTINALQLGIDIGRVIAHTDCPDTNVLWERSRAVIAALGLDPGHARDDDPSFLVGLGFGLADRHKEPLDGAALDLMGQTGLSVYSKRSLKL